MAEETPRKTKGNVFRYIGYIILLIIFVQVGIVLFGDWFKADKTVIKNSSVAQKKLSEALYQVFNDYGKLEVRQDYSVRAYISGKTYMSIPYPDREAAITKVGKTWCEENGINIWYLPKVQICDVQTGEVLGTYRCLLGLVSKK